jgi:hypothetical protein
MVCTPDLYYQEFKFSGADLRALETQVFKKIRQYYELKNDYKEEQHIDTNELLKEFEKEAKQMRERVYKLWSKDIPVKWRMLY